jgi:hypothetical protein
VERTPRLKSLGYGRIDQTKPQIERRMGENLGRNGERSGSGKISPL